MSRRVQHLLFAFAIAAFPFLGIGCGGQGANVAEPEVLNIEDGGIPSPEAGMPKSMKGGATGPPPAEKKAE